MKQDNYQFKWKDIGNLELGRPNLGSQTDIAVYRLMQYSLRSVLNSEFGSEKASDLIYKAGMVAGKEFCSNMLDISKDFYSFISQLQNVLRELNIGILRIEMSDLEKFDFIFSIAEDLECSGLPVTDETVCDFDEGFLAGIMKIYTGKEFIVKEIDCWSTGGRVCRFKINLKL